MKLTSAFLLKSVGAVTVAAILCSCGQKGALTLPKQPASVAVAAK